MNNAFRKEPDAEKPHVRNSVRDTFGNGCIYSTDHKERFLPESTVQKIPQDRSSIGASGISDPGFFSGTLCVCQSTRTGGFFRLRRCLQDRKLCDAGTKCADAVHGVFRFPECRGGQDKTCKTVHVYRNRRRTGCRLPGVPSCYV